EVLDAPGVAQTVVPQGFGPAPDRGRPKGLRHEDPASTDVAQAFRPASISGAIEFRDLVFGYNGRPVLNHVSARIEVGQTVALVGVTGSGKSTLINLLARLHEPPPASVFIDGIDVREIPLADLRRAIGFVPQEPFLFSDTLADNVAFGLDAEADRPQPRVAEDTEIRGGAARMRRIAEAASIARLDKDVADFPRGY